MNDFQSIQSGKGLLKDNYVDTPLNQALKKKRDKLANTKRIIPPSEQDILDQISEDDSGAT